MRWILAIVAALGLAVAFLPLRFVTDRYVPDLEAQQVSGTIWDGKIRGATYQGIPVGDVDAGLAFRPLLRGRTELWFQRLGPRLEGRVGLSQQERQVHNLNGEISIPVLPAPVPPVTVRFDGLSLATDRLGNCRSAGGQVHALVLGIPGIGETAPLSGTPRCDGSAVLAPLADAGGRLGLDLRMWPRGRWRADLRIMTSNPFILGVLGIAGFGPVPGGATISVEGAANRG